MSDLMITDLHAGYADVSVLQGLSIRIPSGRATAVFGRNGCGKSTLLRAISGLIPYKGSVMLGDIQLSAMWAESIAALGIAHVIQGRGTFTSLTVEQNLRLGGSTLSDRKTIRTEVARVYDLFPRLAERRRQIAGTLSGGEQQMLAVGRALVMRPKLVLLDEPSFGLEPRLVALLFDALDVLRRDRNLSLLLVEQNPGLIAGFADEAHLIEGGRVVFTTAADDPELSERLLRSHLS